MDLKLKDKVALVTGTGSQIGYGKGIALTLAQEGCDIISADIDLEGAGQGHDLFGPRMNNYHLWARKLKKAFDPNGVSESTNYITAIE